MMKLYDLEPSGNCYKVRLFAALTHIPLDIVAVDFMAAEHKQPTFLGLNPLGELPVLVDGDFVLRDSQAILVYLALKHGGEAWLPREPMHMALVMQWLSTAANEVQHGPGDARLVDKFGYVLDKAFAVKKSAALLDLLDKHLASRSPLLCPAGTPWLFPRRDGKGPVDTSTLSTRLKQRILKETGIVMNAHLFRHLAAMLYLNENPGAYEAVRRLLGHSSVSKTIAVYTGLETHAVIEAFGNVLRAKKGAR